MIVTTHAADRLKERLGIKQSAALRLCETAFQRGLRREDTDGPLRRYLDALFYREKTADNIRVFGEHVYIFVGDKLITVWGLDPYYKKLVRQHKNQQHKKGEQHMQQTQGTRQNTEAGSTPTVFNPVIKATKPTSQQDFTIGRLIVALELKHKTNKKEISQKLGVSYAGMLAIVNGESKSLGPALAGLFKADPVLLEAANKVIAEGDALKKKAVNNASLIEKAMKLEAQLNEIKRQLSM